MMTSQVALPGMEPPPVEEQELAHVIVDIDVPHLDYPLEYSVPPDLVEDALEGKAVRVFLAGKKRAGWIVQRMRGIPQSSTIQALEEVTSYLPILTESLHRSARVIADKHVATLSQTLSLAIPNRHVRAEKAVLRQKPPVFSTINTPDVGIWEGYAGGAALIQHLASGHSPRAVWTCVPGHRDRQLISLIQATLASRRSIILIVPTGTLAQKLRDRISEYIPESIGLLTSQSHAADRQRIYCESLLGHIRIVIGTRSAVWTPMKNLGAIIVWDDGNDLLREIRAPRTDALEVAVTRSHMENIALICASWTRSLRAQALVRSGWARDIVADLQLRRRTTAIIRVQDEKEIEREGPAGKHRLPPAAMRLIHEGLQQGPVLIHTPFSGYIPITACAHCRQPARCLACSGPVEYNASGSPACTWCGRGEEIWHCRYCQSRKLRAVRIGSERTAEELGRAFTGFPLTVSSAEREISRHIDSTPRIVVSTPGCEPEAENGYAAVLILDAPAVAGRPELWAPEEAIRRWTSALVLARAGAPALITGGLEPSFAQNLIRWDFVDFADRLLDEREALGYFPAATVVALDGQAADVYAMADACGGEILGTVSRPPRKAEQHATVRTLVRWPKETTSDGLHTLKTLQQMRSSRHLPLVKITVNPPELF
ncbi:primosomal protein N' [Schaalia sp. lx-260]|uniref:primosomal protein N' family DNA-binding protein n=1 Tax=Schaalia sp. lx-260 TaxID=2899082 RepID=UPI001E2BE4B6|nr:primosomal protein N' [Schaalia sp. lx-260]MCD4549544.1 primosomal protein N' [Schaalia sp. lx-260]